MAAEVRSVSDADEPVTVPGASVFGVFSTRIRNATLALRWQRMLVITTCLFLVNLWARSLSAAPFGCEPGSNTFRLVMQQCTGSTTFSIHGLWPQWDGGQFCNAQIFNVNALTNIKDDLEEFWPSCPELGGASNVRFWKHEWDKHGSCSGMGLRAYFETTLQLRERTVHQCLLEHQHCTVCLSKDLQPARATAYYSPALDHVSVIISISLLVCAYLGVVANSKQLLCMFSVCNVVLACKHVVLLGVLVGTLCGAMLVGFQRCQLDPKAHDCVGSAKEDVARGLGALLMVIVVFLCMGCACVCRLWAAYQGYALFRHLDRGVDISLQTPHPTSDDLEQPITLAEMPGYREFAST